jgi:hypothetical protein
MSYQLNHPKAYLGYAVALDVGGYPASAKHLTTEYITNGTSMARRGAQHLDLVDDERELTPHGEWVVTQAPRWFGVDDNQSVLEELDGLRGARGRFSETLETLPQGDAFTLVAGDDDITKLIQTLEHAHSHSVDLSLATLVTDCWNEFGEYRLVEQLFLRDDEHVTEHVFTDVGDPEVIDIVPDALEDSHAPSPNGDVPIYQSPTVHQLKTVLWHLGLLVEKGTQAKDIDPTESFWGLEPEADD